MFDKLNNAEQVEEAESVVKVSKHKKFFSQLNLKLCQFLGVIP